MGKGSTAHHPISSSPFPNFTLNADFPRIRSSSMDSKTMFVSAKTAIFMTLWFIFSVASLFIAKHVLHLYHLNETIFTLWQFALSVIFGVTFTNVFRLHTLTPLTTTQLRSIVPLSLTFLVKEVLKYAALSRVSVNLVNTIRSLGPLFNVILEFICLGYRPHRRVLYALIPIIIGVALTSFDEIHVASTTMDSLLIAIFGFIAAILSTAINNGQNIYSKILFGRERIDPVSLQIYLSAISFAIMFPFTFIQLTYQSIQQGRLTHELVLPSKPIILGLVVAGFINFVASQLAFNTLRLVSPLSYSVANTFKRVTIAVIAIFYFNERLSNINGIGIVISIMGIFIYERQSRSQKEAKQYRSLPLEDVSSNASQQHQLSHSDRQHHHHQFQNQPHTNINHLSSTTKRTHLGPDLSPLKIDLNHGSTTTLNGEHITTPTATTPVSSGDAIQRHLYVDVASPSLQKSHLRQPSDTSQIRP